MERRTIRISDKRQMTIPQKFFERLGFSREAECILKNDELVIRPVRERSDGAFDEQILADLIEQGYGGAELLAAFKAERRKVRPAVESMLAEAEAAARGESQSFGMEEVFGGEDEP